MAVVCAVNNAFLFMYLSYNVFYFHNMGKYYIGNLSFFKNSEKLAARAWMIYKIFSVLLLITFFNQFILGSFISLGVFFGFSKDL